MQHLILYAEDEISIAMLTIKEFEKAGYMVNWAEDGQKALEKYREEAPDIIILDIKMPKMDGFEVLTEIRKKDLITPVLMLTSFSQDENIIKSYQLNVDVFVRKNVDSKVLLAIIERLIESHPVSKDSQLVITPDTRLDTEHNILYSAGCSKKISFRDCNLLRLFWRHRNKPLRREDLESQVWNDSRIYSEEKLNKSISLLREIMSNDKSIEFRVVRSQSITFAVHGS